jgi:transcriptional regulator with XRE-family HTH domain
VGSLRRVPFATQLQEWCQQKRGRQREVASIIGTTPATVSDWFYDRKEPTSEQILKVLNFLKHRPKEPRKKKAKGEQQPEVDEQTAAEEMEF